jgi:hypothetical protein
MDTWDSFPGGKRPGRKPVHFPPTNVEECVNLYLHSPIRLHGIVIKHRTTLPLTIRPNYSQIFHVVSSIPVFRPKFCTHFSALLFVLHVPSISLSLILFMVQDLLWKLILTDLVYKSLVFMETEESSPHSQKPTQLLTPFLWGKVVPMLNQVLCHKDVSIA